MKHVVKVSCKMSSYVEIEAENYWEAVLKASNMLKEGKIEVDKLLAEKTEADYIEPCTKGFK